MGGGAQVADQALVGSSAAVNPVGAVSGVSPDDSPAGAPDATGDAMQPERASETKQNTTPLRDVHEQLGATLIPFAGWLMPLRYASETAEHNAVRTAAGLFDLSHMGEISVSGPDADAALDYALVGHLSAVAPGRARYTMICADDGGVIDDLVVYRLAEDDYLVVANAANTSVVFGQLRERAAEHDAAARRGSGESTAVTDATQEYALIAIQGPAAAAILARRTEVPLGGLKYYAGLRAAVAGVPVLLARTGYTGEDGFELFCRAEHAASIWTALTEAGAGDGLVPAGLAARDTLRLEAGMPLYGNELSTDVTPFEAGLGRVVKLDKPGDFVGRAALAERARTGPRRTLIGLIGQSRRIPRHGYPVLLRGSAVGAVTSGAPSPTLRRPIAMAYVAPDAARQAHNGQARLAVDVRGKAEQADYAQLPFYHRAR